MKNIQDLWDEYTKETSVIILQHDDIHSWTVITPRVENFESFKERIQKHLADRNPNKGIVIQKLIPRLQRSTDASDNIVIMDSARRIDVMVLKFLISIRIIIEGYTVNDTSNVTLRSWLCRKCEPDSYRVTNRWYVWGIHKKKFISYKSIIEASEKFYLRKCGIQ